MRLRLGVVGGGLIAQAVHLPNLARLGDRFEVCALADPSERVRERLSARYGLRPYADWRELVEREELDAVLVCSPHATHAEVVLAALEAGLHVFVEKPLCIDPADAQRIADECAGRRRVVQVGYMKRFDPGFEALLSDLPGLDGLRYVDVVTYDPWLAREPFVDVASLIAADDVPVDERQRIERLQVEQVEAVVGSATEHEAWVFAHVYLACLIHDINLVHGVLQALGEPLPARAVTSSSWAAGNAVAGTFKLSSGAIWNSAWMLLPEVDEFRETAMWYFDDTIVGLEFPAPYVRAAPTRLLRRRRSDGSYRREDVALHGSSYLDELKHFHDCITDGVPCRTPPEQSIIDLAALRALYLEERRARDNEKAQSATAAVVPTIGS